MHKFLEEISEFVTEEQLEDFQNAYYNNSYVCRCVELYEDRDVKYSDIKEVLLGDKNIFLKSEEGSGPSNMISILITMVNVLNEAMDQMLVEKLEKRIQDLEEISKQ